MSKDGPTAGNLTGSLLVAHPGLLDPHFRRTILFLSHHTADDGAIGLVINRPLKKTFGEVTTKKKPARLQDVALFYGGPVATDQVTFASLQWRQNPSTVAFQSFMGNVDNVHIDPEWQPGLRAFVGYAGWSRGQLENEIAQQAWLVLEPVRQIIEMENPDTAWRDIMRQASPMLKILAEAPDDPELN